MSNTDINQSKAYWKKLARKNEALLNGTRVLLASVVKDLGGEITVENTTLADVGAGNFVMNSRSSADEEAPSVTITVVPVKQESVVDPEQNES